jgi:membrane-associated phospholipid phosphatase
VYRPAVQSIHRRSIRAFVSIGSVIGALTLAAQPPTAFAQEPDAHENRVVWQPHWRKVHPIEYGATLAFGLGAIGISFFVDPRASGGHGGVLFDNAFRDLLRADSRSGRDAARVVGDWGYRTMALFPFVDVAITWAVHGNSEVALQMVSMDAEALAVAGFIGIATDHFIGRARPSVEPCSHNDNYEQFCGNKDQFSSFLSGHSVIAAAGAGVTCAHHLSLPLYGGGAGDIAACAASTAFAVTTGIARMVNDRHWATDVTTAWIAGAAVGYVWPRLFHYRSKSDPAAVSFSVFPSVTPGAYAGTVAGLF